jgi:hypothetical protein
MINSFITVATLAQRFTVGDFGYTVIGEPNFMVSFPVHAENFTTSLTSALSTEVQMSFLSM